MRQESTSVIFKILTDAEFTLTKLTGCKVSLSMRVDKEILSQEEALKVSLQQLVVNEFHISWAQMMSKNRERKIVDGRKSYCYLAIEILGQTITETATDLRIHHSSAIHLHRAAKDLIMIGDGIKNKIENIKYKLNESVS